MNEDGSTATNQTEETPASTNPNELEFEMTSEQEQEYVDQILASGNYTPPVDDKPADDTPPEETPPVEEKPEAPKDETPELPEPDKQEVSAPQADDLWIEVERVVTDELGEETTETVRLVYDPADPSSFIPEDFTAKSTKQLADIMDAKSEMAKLFEERQSEFEKAESSKAAVQKEKDLLASWDAEIKDLVGAGVLEAPKLKPGDEGFGKDPANVKTDAIFKYMAEQNTERAKNGIPPIASFGLAYTMFEGSEAKKAADEAEKKDNEETKLKGSMIGGGSAASGGTADQAAYKSGSHHNIWSVPVGD